MFERYTEQARRALFFARYEAYQVGSAFIETEHLLLGLFREEQSPTARVFALAQLSIDDVRREIDVHLGLGYGRHVCLGASLARLESRIAIEELLRRFPVYEVPAGGIERMHSSNVRGFAGLVLEPR